MVTPASLPDDLAREVLDGLAVDWWYLSGVHRTVVSWFVEHGRRHDDIEIVGVTWQVLYRLLVDRLVVVGDLTGPGFNLWDEQGLDAYERLHREVAEIGSFAEVRLGDVAWFELTPQGRHTLDSAGE